MAEYEEVDNSPVCKEHERERIMYCMEHKIWICDICLVQHKKCKGGSLHFTEIIELIKTGTLKQTHTELQKLSNELSNCMSRTKNEFINIIDDYQNNISKSLNFNIDYNNKNLLQLAMQCFRYKQSNEEIQYNKFYETLVKFITELEKSKDLFVDYKIIREEEGFINQHNIHFLREWTGRPRLNIKLIFKASRDGFKALEFHTKCENISPSIVVVKTEFGSLIGGYTEMPWEASNEFYFIKEDKTKTTFLFSFDLHTKLVPKDYKYCISYSKKSGPIFGCKYTKNYAPMLSASYTPDLEIVNECNTRRCNYFDIGKNFIFQGTKEDFFGSKGPFKIEDYELYKVEN